MTTTTSSAAVRPTPDPMYNVDLAQVMFRRAEVESRRAAQYAAEAARDRAGGLSGMERRARERDAVISTVVLVQAAVEAFINWAHIQADNTIGSSNFDVRAKKITTSAAILNPDADAFEWTAEEDAFFTELTKWRNFLGHSDTKARNRLREVLVERGEAPEGASDAVMAELLTATMAARFVDTARALMSRAAAATRTGAPFSAGAWHAPDELADPPLEDPAALRALLRAVLGRRGWAVLRADDLSRELDLQRAGRIGLRAQWRRGKRRRPGRWVIGRG
ncbi:hypothetical protein ACFQ0M_47685 [Kitasatospora aburaviensis]|uniref:Uncharacterized protein n=1 Tax=Kitasatospora aburaviensis TaxID=67265 RepID=A0ABW1EYU2_9ACTN